MIPEKIIVSVTGEFKPGLAVQLKFKMSKKNDYYYTAFLDNSGNAQVEREELLLEFDKTRNFFLMDFSNPRVVFTGQIEARIWSKEEVEKAISAYDKFKQHYDYMPGHIDKLRNALLVNPGINCTVSVEQVASS